MPGQSTRHGLVFGLLPGTLSPDYGGSYINVVRPPPPPHRILDARWGGPGEGCGGCRCRRWPTGHRHHRSRRDVRSGRLLQGGQGGRRKSHHRHRGLRRRRLPLRPAPGERERPLSHDPAGREPDRLPQPDEALLQVLPRGLLLQAPDGQRTAGRPLRRDRRHLGMPRRPGGQAPRPRRFATRMAGQGRPGISKARSRLPRIIRTSSAETTSSSRSRTMGWRRSGGSCPT